MPPLPSRPRLARHVIARRHVQAGREQVVLHDLENGNIVAIGPREWVLLAGSDGTRDVGGIVLSALREGVTIAEDAAIAFLGSLHEAGLLEDGPELASHESPLEARPPANRPLVALPGFSLHCDGRGTCCRLYESVLFSPVESACARALRPLVLLGGDREDRVFLPDHGSGPTGGTAVTLVDGACAYLFCDSGNGYCSIHAAAGPLAKPLGCQTFPATFTDDGETIRVSVAVECACVLRTDVAGDGSPLLPDGARVFGDLNPEVVAFRVPDEVVIAGGRSVPRARYLEWSRSWTEETAGRIAAEDDLAMWFVRTAEALEEGGFGFPARVSPLRPEDLAARLSALATRATTRLVRYAGYRSDADHAMKGLRLVAAALSVLSDGEALDAVLSAPVTNASDEALYVRALLHGHELAKTRSITTALRDRATRIIVARAVPLAAALLGTTLEPWAEHPIAVVEAIVRGHGLVGYDEDLG